jgi:hypothetical protein
LLTHDPSDQAPEGNDAGLALAAAELLDAMNLPGRDVGQSAGAGVFVLDENRSSPRGAAFWIWKIRPDAERQPSYDCRDKYVT